MRRQIAPLDGLYSAYIVLLLATNVLLFIKQYFFFIHVSREGSDVGGQGLAVLFATNL